MQNNQKIILGQFFTRESVWLKEHVKRFIIESRTDVVYDPFAGEGDLIDAAKSLGYRKLVGLDIDEKLSWEHNDSLLRIPPRQNAIIITNPPYISNYSAARKKIGHCLKKYFETSKYDDLYLIALDRMLEAQEYVVAIIPETFINSNYLQKDRLVHLTVLEENPFNDTDTPVLVACFDGRKKSFEEIQVFKNDEYISSLDEIEKYRLVPNKKVEMIFNDRNGWLGVRCIDTTDPKETLRFAFKENIAYDWEKGIKHSSRLLTLISIDVPKEKRQVFIDECNRILNDIRNKTQDIIFSPFKGNMKSGKRRRRLDFLTCRAIIEKSYYKTVGGFLGDI